MSEPSGSSTDSGRVLHEETLSLRDKEGAGRLISGMRYLVGFMIVVTLGGVAVFVWSGAQLFVDAFGGVEPALAAVGTVRTERPQLFFGVVLVVVLVVGYGVFSILGFVWQMRRAFDREVHVQVTETGVSVRREGGSWYQSRGVEIPIDAITAVEYADPDEPSLRIELGDWRAKRFFAGRSRDWIRLERRGGPAVYVGSDRPEALAGTIAREVGDGVTAKPY